MEQINISHKVTIEVTGPNPFGLLLYRVACEQCEFCVEDLVAEDACSAISDHIEGYEVAYHECLGQARPSEYDPDDCIDWSQLWVKVIKNGVGLPLALDFKLPGYSLKPGWHGNDIEDVDRLAELVVRIYAQYADPGQPLGGESDKIHVPCPCGATAEVWTESGLFDYDCATCKAYLTLEPILDMVEDTPEEQCESCGSITKAPTGHYEIPDDLVTAYVLNLDKGIFARRPECDYEVDES